ncbi:cysteine proteinase inhibitor-like isoform X2 [Primulina eburnea]|uniref:cysteine proteinase inhibitor-like isoform X2 n=1 Tax=Primulina eburnea TaxID=1245227 RepID=UPI003C6C1F99
MAATGNVRECEGSQNSIEIEDLARFAVEEHNKKQGDYVEFFLGLEVHFKCNLEEEQIFQSWTGLGDQRMFVVIYNKSCIR